MTKEGDTATDQDLYQHAIEGLSEDFGDPTHTLDDKGNMVASSYPGSTTIEGFMKGYEPKKRKNIIQRINPFNR